MVTYRCAAATDVGRSKRRNEDSVTANGADTDGRTFVVAVADGLGGYPGGDIASRLAVEAVSGDGPSDPPIALADAAHVAVRRHIMDIASSDPEMMQMATTLTFAVLGPDATVLIGHVGDSRAYIGDGTDLIQVTIDHTVAMDKVQTGELSIADAELDPRWHILSNWIGWEPHRLETWELRVEPGDRLLLCSDGLSNMIDDARIAELLFSGTPQTTSRRLIDAANEAGGSDNISVVVVEVEAS